MNDKIENVKSSYARCLSKGDVIQRFYDIFLASHPDIKPKFKNTDFDKQKKLLRHGLNLMVMFAKGDFAGKMGLERIQHTHCKMQMNIEPKFYGYWKDSLVKAVSEYDRDFTPELKKEWDEVLEKGISFIKEGYLMAK